MRATRRTQVGSGAIRLAIGLAVLVILLISMARYASVVPRMLHGSMGPNGNRLEQASAKALRFLQRVQLSSGAFPGVLCETRQLSNCLEDITPFVSTFVLHDLSLLPPEREPALRKRTINFLLASQRRPGLWAYWLKDNPLHVWAAPDLDDTSCVRAALARAGQPMKVGLEEMLRMRTPQGVFWTWFDMSAQANEVDCAVNANVVFDMGVERQQVSEAVAYLNGLFPTRAFDSCSPYYLRAEALFYFISRAYREGGVMALQPAVTNASELLPARQQPDGGFGDAPHTAFAALTWLNAGKRGPELERAVGWLLDHQRPDGGWDAAATYWRSAGSWAAVYFASEAMTTALALETFIKAQRQSK